MLESYYVKPQTIDQIRESWVGPEIERYVDWLAEHRYSARTVVRRIPLFAAFGEFARSRGAKIAADLPAHVDAFVEERVSDHRGVRHGTVTKEQVVKEFRGPIEQMLAVTVPGFEGSGRRHLDDPFTKTLPGFFDHLVTERGLRPETIRLYVHYLHRFEAYLARVEVHELRELSPALLSASRHGIP